MLPRGILTVFLGQDAGRKKNRVITWSGGGKREQSAELETERERATSVVDRSCSLHCNTRDSNQCCV